MELRKDPITRSWVVVGHPERGGHRPDPCALCPEHRIEPRSLLEMPGNGPWQIRVIPHFRPLYHIEGEPGRCAEGIYDCMSAVGAHEVIVEARDHLRTFSQLSDDESTRVLEVYAMRILDLKRDARFKYVSIFKNQGPAAAEDWAHAHSQVMATTFVPRRMSYELRAAREWYRDHERCVFCDILRQEIREKKRLVECVGDYYAFCPYASRVPYETWILPRTHNHQFEAPLRGEHRSHLATLLGRTLRRLTQVTNSYHMVLHTAPNTLQTKGELSNYWRTIQSDYHWHFEILPILSTTSKSYGLKEVYFNGILPEEAAERLRQLDPGEMMARFRKPQAGGIIFRLAFYLFLGAFLLVIYLVRYPLLRVAGGFWIVNESPQSSDAIVILSDDNYNGDRAAKAADIFKAGWAPRVIASGRYLRPYAGIAELEARDLESHGVPESAIVPFSHHASDTREECIAIGQLLSSRGWKRILLVTSNYHTRRSEYICERAFPQGTALRVIAASDSEYDPRSWWQSRSGLKIFLHELVGFPVAIWEMRHQSVQTASSSLFSIQARPGDKLSFKPTAPVYT